MSRGENILGGVSLPFARVQAQKLKEELALKTDLAKYNLKKSGSQSKIISGRTSAPVGYRQEPLLAILPSAIEFPTPHLPAQSSVVHSIFSGS